MSESEEKRRRVVVVDDDSNNLSLIDEALSMEGYEVYSALSGETGLKKIDEVKPDLVLLDYNMPGMTGLDVLVELRKRKNYVAVIFISADPDEDCIRECLQLGADDYIKKPFHFSELSSRVKVRFRIKDLHDALQEANAKLKELSEHDDLTSLFNMRSMYQKIDYELRRSKRYGRRVACVMMDMDNFKTINDGADHLFGSFVIQQVGELIANNIRDVDLAARYGGDEFLVVLPEVSMEGPSIFAERLRKVIANHVFDDGKHQAQRTLSIGYSISDPSENISAVDLVRQADHALYQSKKAGRNRVSLYMHKQN